MVTNYAKGNTVTEETTAQEATLEQIIAEHASKTAEIMTGYLDETERIRQESTPEDGRYLDQLSDQDRTALLYQQKVARVDAAHTSTREAYATQTEAFHAEHAARVKVLEARLFKVEDTAAASRAATASESDLASMLDFARLSGNKGLGRAAFVGAHARGAGHLVGRFFDEVDPDARAPYQEYAQRVAPEVLERQRDATRVVQEPDYARLMPPARVGA